MRSPKSELYLLVKAILMGGTYIDYNSVSRTYTGLTSLKQFGFWNNTLDSESDNIALPACFFELAPTTKFRTDFRISETHSLQTTKDNVEFILHVVNNKMYSEIKENSYLDCIDLAQLIIDKLTNVTVMSIRNINHISDEFDRDSKFILDYPVRFSAQLVNVGQTVFVDANDPLVNEDAPVEFNLSNPT